MVTLIAMPQGITTDGKCQYDHYDFKYFIVNDVDTKQWEGGKK